MKNIKNFKMFSSINESIIFRGTTISEIEESLRSTFKTFEKLEKDPCSYWSMDQYEYDDLGNRQLKVDKKETPFTYLIEMDEWLEFVNNSTDENVGIVFQDDRDTNSVIEDLENYIHHGHYDGFGSTRPQSRPIDPMAKIYVLGRVDDMVMIRKFLNPLQADEIRILTNKKFNQNQLDVITDITDADEVDFYDFESASGRRGMIRCWWD